MAVKEQTQATHLADLQATCGKQPVTFSARKNYSRKTVLEQTLSRDRKLPHWHNNAGGDYFPPVVY